MISVIIPHLDQPQSLRLCLASLASQTGVEQPIEIIVVDNGSKELPTDVCKAFVGVTLLLEPVPGPGPARNRGVSRAKGKILAFIDADCLAEKSWLSEIERRFAADRKATILGGDVRIAYDNPDDLTMVEAYESVFAYRMKEYIAKQGFTGTGNLAMRAQISAAVGPFGGIDVAEDRDWGQRALRQGHVTHYCPNMIVFHPARKNFGELTRKWDRHTAHDFARVRSKQGWRVRWIVRTIAIALSPVAEVARIGLSDRVSGWRQRSLALLGVICVRSYRARIMLPLAFGGNVAQLSGRWNQHALSMSPREKP